MEDLRQLALELLEIEKRILLKEKTAYSVATAVVITPSGRYFEEPEFGDEREKEAAYAEIVKKAKERNSSAIIAINTARQRSLSDESELDSYQWGGPAIRECSESHRFSNFGARNRHCLFKSAI